MSQHQINQYLNALSDLRRVSGTHRESVVREAFKDLLKNWGRAHDLVFIPEYKITTPARETRYVDGALLYAVRVPFGYWEAKDEQDDLEAEIALKFARGYPRDNIIFEDSTKAVLYQNASRVAECAVTDVVALQKLITQFFAYERPEIADFKSAVAQFKTDLPAILAALRAMILGAEADNAAFATASAAFLTHARDVINPALTDTDVREILIQHILTEGVFAAVFPNAPFHSDNNVARELYRLEATFFTGNTKYQTLKGLEPYYAAIRAAAAQISSHHEKQNFLKAIYEDFYKVYNTKMADRLGVVYTPNEIVRFMIESADYLCEKHFGKNLIDRGVDILDPATGTGTYICELLEYFRGQPDKLKHKYQLELHANEVAILPYYVANLNIEATYAAIMDEYAEFPNLCFVDTLDNVFALNKRIGQMGDLFGAVSEENTARIRKQNARTISVIIGNPPYNANQANENDNNKNREYREIDDRIKATYIKKSTAQKTKVYDMYARFFRWASDRVDENGIVAFITNRSFIDSRTFDGFRKDAADEFDDIYIVDLGGDVRANPKLSGTKNNVFGIQTGVAISFMIRRSGKKGKDHQCQIHYARRPEMDTAEDKLAFVANTKLRELSFEKIKADKRSQWLEQTDNDFESFIPVASKKAKASKISSEQKAIFKLYSLGAVTNRDDWMTDFSIEQLEKKVKLFCNIYSTEVSRWKNFVDKKYNKSSKKEQLRNFVSRDIKWTEELETHLDRGTNLVFSKENLRVKTLYRPFVSKCMYYSKVFTHRTYQQESIFPISEVWNNLVIGFTVGGRLPFTTFGTNVLPSLTVLSLDANQTLPLYRYTAEGQRIDNITDWALKQFQKHYAAELGKKAELSKEDIFHYTYAVLHDPVYREKYALNLKRDFPHIPFYADFCRWSAWGRALMDLHIGYKTVPPFPITRHDAPAKDGVVPKARLKSDAAAGTIRLDDVTVLSGISTAAWEYRLGNRAALDWVLDQHKERKPKDPTIREKFDTYRFADYKEKVVDLLGRVAAVSVATVAITDAMRAVPRPADAA